MAKLASTFYVTVTPKRAKAPKQHIGVFAFSKRDAVREAQAYMQREPQAPDVRRFTFKAEGV